MPDEPNDCIRSMLSFQNIECILIGWHESCLTQNLSSDTIPIDSAGPPVNEDFTMRACSKCKVPRTEGSFFDDDMHPRDICKPCIYRPAGTRVRRLRHTANRAARTQAAIRYVVKHTQTEKQPFVYLVKVGNECKIGFSTNIDKRIRQMETTAHLPVEILAVAPGGRLLEKTLHKELREFRIKGEWFLKSNTLIERFSHLQSVMVFLPGYVQATPSLSSPVA